MTELSDLQKKFKDYKTKTDAKLAKLKDQLDDKGVTDVFGDTKKNELFDTIGSTAQQLAETERAIKNISQASLNFKNNNFLKQAFSDAVTQSNLLIASTTEGRKATESLAKSLGSISEYSKILSKESKNLIGVLGAQSAALRVAGLDSERFNKSIDITTFSLKGNAEAVESVNLRLAKFAYESGVSTKTVSDNYQALAKNLMIDSRNIERELIRTQKVEQQTGVSVGKQRAAFSGVTTDFSAASSMAGNLNALLGGNKLSATELFMSLGPGEVQEKIKEALKGTRMEKDLQSTATDRMSVKRRQLAIHTLAKNTNLQADDVRRMYGGMPEDSVQRGIASKTDATFDSATKATDKFGQTIKDTTDTLQTFVDKLLSQQGSVEALQVIRSRRDSLRAPSPSDVSVRATAMEALTGGALNLGKEYNYSDLIQAGTPAAEMSSITRLNQMVTRGKIDKQTAVRLMNDTRGQTLERIKRIEDIEKSSRPFDGEQAGPLYRYLAGKVPDLFGLRGTARGQPLSKIFNSLPADQQKSIMKDMPAELKGEFNKQKRAPTPFLQIPSAPGTGTPNPIGPGPAGQAAGQGRAIILKGAVMMNGQIVGELNARGLVDED